MTELQNAPFALIGVNSDRDLEAIRKTVKEEGINWRSFQNQPKGADASISSAWGVRGWPTLIVIDADFRIRYRGHSGEAATAVVRKLLADL